jgi:hypothetical protein
MITRRNLLKLGAISTLVPFAARAQSAQEQKLLFVVTASGGASILDSFLPITTNEAGAGVRAFTTQQVVQPNGSNLRTVAVLDNSIEGAIALGNQYPMATFLGKHKDDVVVMTHNVTSVNHLVAAKRSLTGAGVDKGRTILEAAAVRHGAGCVLPNVNMAGGGYSEHGDDPTVPDEARAEPVVDARLFAFSTDGSRGIKGAPSRQRIEEARALRARLEEASGFGKTFRGARVIRRYLAQRDGIARGVEDADLITKLMMLTETPGEVPLSDYDLETSASGPDVMSKFPNLMTDPVDAQGALAFLLARYGIACAITLGPNSSPVFESSERMLQPPIAFDWSHNDHVGAQNSMWSRTLKLVDGLIELLKGAGLWDRSLVYIATEFGREKSGAATGHHLNNGSVLISPLLRGNRVFGGVDTSTGLTYGFDRTTGEPAPGTLMGEADVYSVIAQALDIEFANRVDIPCMVR